MIRNCFWAAVASAALFASPAIGQNSVAGTPGPNTAAGAPGGQPAAAAAPEFKLRTTNVTLPADMKAAGFDLLIDVTGTNLTDATITEVKDVGLQGSPGVIVPPPLQLQHVGGDAEKRLWRVSGTVADLPLGARTDRLLVIQYAGGSVPLSYSVSRAAAGEFGWTVLGPAGALNWNAETAVPVRIRVQGPIAATAPSLLAGTLLESSDFDPLDLQLCSSPKGECAAPGTILPGQTAELYLRPRSSEALLPGEYKGNLQIAAPQRLQADTVALTLYVSSWRWKLLGLLCLMFGVALAWFVTVAGRAALNRKTLQRVAALLRERLERLESRLLRQFPDGGKIPNTMGAIGRVRDKIGEADAALPGRIPSPWAAAGGGETFEALVKEIDARLDVLAVVIDEGLMPLAAKDPAWPTVARAIETVDALAIADEAKADAVRAAVAAAVASAQPPLDEFATARAGSAEGMHVLPSAARLAYEIERLSGMTWLFILIVTVLVGTLVMLLPNKGFGRWDDYVACLLWGFGLPVAATQISNLGFGSVKTSLGVTAPA